jgi:peptidoglycan/LPS O-acetylase OafA/YrhL
VLFAAVVIEGTRESSWWDVLGLATFLGDFQTSGGRLAIGQAWSLAMEVRFYLALPIAGIVLVGLKRLLGGRLSSGARIVFVLIALGIAYEASRRYAISHSRDVTVSFGSYVLFFVPGIALAVLEHVVPARIVGRRWAGRVAAWIFTTGVALTLFAYSLTFHVPSPWDQYLVPAGVSAVVAGPLLWQWTGRSAWRTLDNPVLHWIGERSYPLFLFHGLVLVNLGPLLVSGGYKQTLLVLGPIGLALSLVCADLLHRFVERPALRRKRDYADGLRSPAELGELQRTSTA